MVHASTKPCTNFCAAPSCAVDLGEAPVAGTRARAAFTAFGREFGVSKCSVREEVDERAVKLLRVRDVHAVRAALAHDQLRALGTERAKASRPSLLLTEPARPPEDFA